MTAIQEFSALFKTVFLPFLWGTRNRGWVACILLKWHILLKNWQHACVHSCCFISYLVPNPTCFNLLVSLVDLVLPIPIFAKDWNGTNHSILCQ
jgi:hypothetical protein